MLNAQVIVSEDFESYAAGSMIVESAGDPWTTWSNMPGSAEDIMISTGQASSGENSLLFESATPATGGPGDIILKLGDRTEGIYGIGWMMYIPAGNGGYFNIQHAEVPGQWGLDVTFRADNSIEFTTNNTTTTTATFPHDEWFEVSILINLAISQGTLSVNDGDPLAWDFNATVTGEPGVDDNQLGAINFYTYAGGDPVMYYIDDVAFVDLSTVNVEEQVLAQVAIYPNPVTDVLTVELPEASGTTLVSLVDLTGRTVIEGRNFMQQGNMARTQVNMNALPQGIYMVRVQDGDREIVRRVVRQ